MKMTNDLPVTPDQIPLSVPVWAATKLLPIFTGQMPLPPSTNSAYMVGKIHTEKGDVYRIIPSPALEQFKSEAAFKLSQAHHDYATINAIRESKRKVPLAVVLRAYFATEWKRDLDGVIKFSIDAAFTRMQLNDNLIIQLEAHKFVDPQEPRVEIDVRCVVR